MPKVSSDYPGRKVGDSITRRAGGGTVVPLANPIDKGYLCQHICGCKEGTAILSKSGQELKQRCTTRRIWAAEDANSQVWSYKAEVGFNMKESPPAPLMSASEPHRPSRFPLGRAVGQGILKRRLEGPSQKGILRIPDCIILKVSGTELAAMRASGNIDWNRLLPIKRNIDTVCEIKFDDELTDQQLEAYQEIGGAEKFRLLRASDCDCSEKRKQPAEQPVRAPVTVPFASSSRQERDKYVAPLPQPVQAPRPTEPNYGEVPANAGTPLSDYLLGAAAVGGCILIGMVAIAALPAELVAGGVALLVIGRTANAGPRKKD